MKRSHRVVPAMVAFALTAIGCGGGSMGMDRGEVALLPVDQAPVVDNAQIQEELGRRPQLPARPRIAVVFRSPSVEEEGSSPFRFDYVDRQVVMSAAAELESVDLFPLSERQIGNGTLDEIRFAGARHGADAVIIVDGEIEQEVSGNGWLATYVLLVPILFAPGADLETTFRVDAHMVDVRNGYLYMSAEAEVDDEQQRAHVWIDREESTDESKLLAMQRLSEEIKTRLVAMLGRRQPEPPVTEPAEPEPAVQPVAVVPVQPAPDPMPTIGETAETTNAVP